jgi:ParB family chromosome partitioning protein
LLAVANPEQVARLAIERGSSVRDLEKLSRQPDDQQGEPHHPRSVPQKDADTRAIEKILEDQLGMTVSISHGGQGGELKIRYKTLDQLEDLCQRLRR